MTEDGDLVAMSGSSVTEYGSKAKHPRNKFSAEEDAQLRWLVEAHRGDWSTIALSLPGRNVRQVRDRWMNYLSPEVHNDPWADEEDAMLIEKVQELGHTWKKISECFPGRTEINVRSRWQMIERRREKGQAVRDQRQRLPRAVRVRPSGLSSDGADATSMMVGGQDLIAIPITPSDATAAPMPQFDFASRGQKSVPVRTPPSAPVVELSFRALPRHGQLIPCDTMPELEDRRTVSGAWGPVADSGDHRLDEWAETMNAWDLIGRDQARVATFDFW